jgi:hypothetical protein
MGRMLAEFRKASNDFKRTIEDEIEAEKVRPEPPPVIAAQTELPVTGTGTPDAPPAEDPAPPASTEEPAVRTPEEATVGRDGGGPHRD